MYYVDDLLIYERKETIWNHVQKYGKDWAVYSEKFATPSEKLT